MKNIIDMAEARRKSDAFPITPEQQEKLKKSLDSTNFDPNAVLRGAQLTVVGGSYILPDVLELNFEVNNLRSFTGTPESKAIHI